MSIRLRDVLMSELPALRYEPIDKRIRATLDGATVVDTVRALLVWEPRRIVPTYAVPIEDLQAELVPAGGEDARSDEEFRGVDAMGMPHLGDRPVLDPSVPFGSAAPQESRSSRDAAGQKRPPSAPRTRTSTAT